MSDSRETLDQVGVRCGTDKSSIKDGHGYLGLYEDRLKHLRDESFFMIEIGVFAGASLAMWAEYFSNAKILGVDIDPATIRYQTPRTPVKIANASMLEPIDEIVAKFGRPLLVIDDGSHIWSHQIETLRYLWPKILPGGIFIMEDIHTSFPALADRFRGHSDISCYDYIQRINRWVVGKDWMVDEVPTDGFISNYSGTIRSIEWHKNTVILNKKPH